MRLRLKSAGTNLDTLTQPMVNAIAEIMEIYRARGMQHLVIDSAYDGHHKPLSSHYTGNAIDIRSRTLADAIGTRDEIQERLGNDFDVVLKKDHIHVEFDPWN